MATIDLAPNDGFFEKFSSRQFHLYFLHLAFQMFQSKNGSTHTELLGYLVNDYIDFHPYDQSVKGHDLSRDVFWTIHIESKHDQLYLSNNLL